MCAAKFAQQGSVRNESTVENHRGKRRNTLCVSGRQSSAAGGVLCALAGFPRQVQESRVVVTT
jgi:hypothetical protein